MLVAYMVMTHEDSDNNRMQVIISFTRLLLTPSISKQVSFSFPK